MSETRKREREKKRRREEERERGFTDIHVHSYLCCCSTRFIGLSFLQTVGIHLGVFCKISGFDHWKEDRLRTKKTRYESVKRLEFTVRLPFKSVVVCLGLHPLVLGPWQRPGSSESQSPQMFDPWLMRRGWRRLVVYPSNGCTVAFSFLLVRLGSTHTRKSLGVNF